MKIYSVYDNEFKRFGKLLNGFETEELLAAMNKIPLPEEGTDYEPSIAALEACSIYDELEGRGFGGMPIQIGMCWGRNTKLNCLEYHRDSEINIGTEDFILLLAREDDIDSGALDTSKVTGFKVPAGIAAEIFATTLHYAPCHTDCSKGFRVAVVLPRGTNTEKPDFTACSLEDRMLRARNKWLIAHPDSPEAADGAYVGLTGENIDISGIDNI